MRDRKIEQSIRVIALILLFGSFLFNTPLSISKQEEKIEVPSPKIDNVTLQDKDSFLSFKYEENFYCKFNLNNSDSTFYCFNTQRD